MLLLFVLIAVCAVTFAIPAAQFGGYGGYPLGRKTFCLCFILWTVMCDKWTRWIKNIDLFIGYTFNFLQIWF